MNGMTLTFILTSKTKTQLLTKWIIVIRSLRMGEGDGSDPVLGREGEGSLSSHCPDAEELSNGVEHHLLLVHHLHRQG